MRIFKSLILTCILSLISFSTFADACCKLMRGVNYCDSSTGRLVCNNGFYSACYCTPHAVMDLQLLRGCCLWHGGVLSTLGNLGLITCNDGSTSEECTVGTPIERVAVF